MDKYDFLDPLRTPSARRRSTRRRGLGAMAALAVLVAGGLVAMGLCGSNAGQARHAVAAHPAEAPVPPSGGAVRERDGGWQFYAPLY
jgi:hypothetical protein